MMRNLVNGAVGGALATAAMSVVMVGGGKAGLMGDQPPKRIVRAVLPGGKRRSKPGEGVLGAVAHFGFGSGFGALFGLLSRGRPVPVSYGVAYALAIWLGSYAGWVPRLTTIPSITRDYPGRPVVMGSGHLVYGATLAVLLNGLAARARPAPRPVRRTRPADRPVPAYH